MNTMTLIGAEDIARAGYAMRDAAQEMTRAASAIEESLRQHRAWADDWLQRLEAALNHPVPPGNRTRQWCCEEGRRQGVAVCAKCAETSAAYSAAMGASC